MIIVYVAHELFTTPGTPLVCVVILNLRYTYLVRCWALASYFDDDGDYAIRREVTVCISIKVGQRNLRPASASALYADTVSAGGTIIVVYRHCYSGVGIIIHVRPYLPATRIKLARTVEVTRQLMVEYDIVILCGCLAGAPFVVIMLVALTTREPTRKARRHGTVIAGTICL